VGYALLRGQNPSTRAGNYLKSEERGKMRGSFISEADMDEWEVVETDRGTGMVCPFDDCGARFLINIDRFKDCVGRRGNSRTCLCPSCERKSLVPEAYQ